MVVVDRAAAQAVIMRNQHNPLQGCLCVGRGGASELAGGGDLLQNQLYRRGKIRGSGLSRMRIRTPERYGAVLLANHRRYYAICFPASAPTDWS